MVRSTLIAAGAMLLCGASFAQQQAGPLYPITGPIQRAPVINLRTGQPLSPAREAQMRAFNQIVYDNTCTAVGPVGYYWGGNPCEDHIDEGRIPGGIGGNNPLGSSTDNNVTFFEISYCTTLATGSVDVQVGFYNNLGQCAGINPVPPPLSTQGTIFQLPVATLQGSGCWIAGFDLGNVGFCMPSDGDGVFDNIANLDVFNWSWRFASGSGGMLLSGEPVATVPGSCTYNIPCSTDPLYANPCGSGLDTSDEWWVNTDGDPSTGGNTNPLCTALGTGCYWFGGHPANPLASYWLRLGSLGSCGGCAAQAVNYCTAGTTTNGCNATMTLQSGIPSASNAAPAVVAATGVEGAKTGLIFFGIGQQAVPWSPASSSFLCVKSPTLRTPVQATNGTSGACNGAMSIDINAQLAAQGVFPVVAGSVFDIQAWFRDPPAPKTTHLSNGLEIVLCP